MSTIRDQIKAAIYGQESSSGQADTSQENYAGARGPMQVTRTTFEGMKSKGLIPQDWTHDNPEQTMKAGNILIDTLADKYGDDPRKVAAAYYAGEKAVRADGSIADFRDKKNPKAPTTLQYVQQVMTRMGLTDEAAEAGGGPVPQSSRYDITNWRNEPMPERTPKARSGPVMKEAPETLPTDPTVLPEGNPEALRLQKETERLQAGRHEIDESGFLDKARAGWMHNGIAGAALKQIVRPQYEPTPGYDPRLTNKELYEGRSEADQLLLDQATSPEHAARLDWEIKQRNEDLRQVNLSGTGVGIAAMIFGGLPEGYVTGLGAMKAFQLTKVASALNYAAQGRKAAAMGAAAFENVVGNVATTALQDVMDPYVGKDDYAMAAGMGLVGTALHLHGLGAQADAAAAKKLGDKIMTEAAETIQATRQKAIDNLGADATPEALVAEMRRLEAEAIQKDVSNAVSELPENRQLLPRDMFDEKPASQSEAKGWESVEGGVQPDPNLGRPRKTEDPAYWHESGSEKVRLLMAHNDPGWIKGIQELGEGISMAEAVNLKPGVHVMPDAQRSIIHRPVVNAIKDLARQFLPGSNIVLGVSKTMEAGKSGAVVSAGRVHIIGLNSQLNPTQALTTGIHELGHAIFHQTFPNIPKELLGRMASEHQAFIKELRTNQAAARFKRTAEGTSGSVLDASTGKVNTKPMADNDYTASFDEYTAEAFVRYVQKKAREEGQGGLVIDKGAVALLKAVWEKIKNLWETARHKGYLPKDEAFEEFFDRVWKGTLSDARAVPMKGKNYLDASEAMSFDQNIQAALPADPIAVKYGLTNMPVDSMQQRAEAAAVLSLYKKADAWAKSNPIDESRLKSLTDNNVFNVASTGLLMLKSDNPVVRMIASELLESASGAAGRQSTAAIAKYMNERAYMGNTINELQSHYTIWRNQQGGNVVGDFTDGKLWAQFNRLVAQEIESRRGGGSPVQSSPAIMQAANVLEQAYDRMRVAQTNAKTIGWAGLPVTSKGYMPHTMSAEKVRNMTSAQEDALHGALVDQFIGIEGFDITFSQNLASKYIDRIRRRALGGYEVHTGIHQVGAADAVEEALNQMGMTKGEVTAMMKRYLAGSPGHTKRRLKLDLNAEHPDGKGGTFTLLDLFETDQLKLVRNQAQRVSGEVALARHGVMGKPGLSLLRRAMEFGEDGKKATAQEIEAFDQVSAEFLGQPFGDQGGPWLQRAMQVNSLARLGGMGFTQFAEYINGITHVGAARVLSAVGGMKRLRDEAKALARGEKVDNPIIGSLERQGGAEFGTDAYKMVFPFDNGELQYQTYGKDTVTFADRALRGATHLQGKLSFWRSIHSAQQRGMAEQIVHKAVKFIRDGGEDAALADMGIDQLLIGNLRKDLPYMAEFDGAGNLVRFDITKASDPRAADEFIQAVHRGTSQIIQGTFIGETGKWAHSGLLRMMTQFRSFSITSVEKQWARQVGNHGVASALGILMGSMSLAAPIYIARTVAAAQGRDDKDEYLDKQLSAAQIARAALNYVAMSGLSGDLLDALTAVSGVGHATGARSGSGSQFIGNVIAPSAGLVDDLWRGIQNTKEGTDPHDLLKAMPFSRLPWMIPVIEGLGSE